MRASAILCLAIALGAGGLGCKAKGVGGECDDIDACGSTLEALLGSWNITGVCQYSVPQPYLLMSPIPPAQTQPQTPAYSPAPPPLTTSGDWCSGLIYRPEIVVGTQSNVEAIQFYHAPLDFQQGNLVFTHDPDSGAYVYALTTTLEHTQTTHFTRECLNAYGANPSCDDLATGLQNEPNPNYQAPPGPDGMPMERIPCVATDDNGCDCTYTLEGTGSSNGTFKLDGGDSGSTLYWFSLPPGDPPHAMDICQQGNNLTIGGADGSAITGSVGFRAMSLEKTQ